MLDEIFCTVRDKVLYGIEGLFQDSETGAYKRGNIAILGLATLAGAAGFLGVGAGVGTGLLVGLAAIAALEMGSKILSHFTASRQAQNESGEQESRAQDAPGQERAPEVEVPNTPNQRGGGPNR